MASVIKMKPSYKVSVHAIEKHLNSDNTDASIFFNGRLMHDSIRKCLDKPDKKNDCGKRYELIKTFSSEIGVLGYSNRTSNTIKLVCTRTKKLTIVITAYPIPRQPIIRYA